MGKGSFQVLVNLPRLSVRTVASRIWALPKCIIYRNQLCLPTPARDQVVIRSGTSRHGYDSGFTPAGCGSLVAG